MNELKINYDNNIGENDDGECVEDIDVDIVMEELRGNQNKQNKHVQNKIKIQRKRLRFDFNEHNINKNRRIK
eukprot:UN06030